VTDGDGAGVEGVVLRAQRRGDGSGGASPADVGREAPELQSLEETVRKAVNDYSRSRSNLFETRTDATGAYRFEGLPDGTWRIRAYKRDHVISAQADSSEVRPGTQLDFRTEPVISVPVSVYTPSGKLARTAILDCDAHDDRSNDRYKWNADEAVLRLGPGSYEITALSADSISGRVGYDDDAEQKSESQRIVLEAGKTPKALRFELAGRLGIRGYVTLPNDGVEGVNPRVLVLPLAPGEAPDLELLAESDQSTWVRSGREYSFLDLEAGQHAVGVSRSWRTPIEAHEVVEVADGIVRCDLELPPIDRSKFIHVSVLGPDGAPVIGVDFSMRAETEHGSWSGGVQEMRDSDGSYLLGLREEYRDKYFGDAGGNTFTLTASHETYGSKTEDLQPGQLEVTILLAPPAELEVTIAGYQGSGYEGRLEVSADAIDDDEGSTHWFRGGRNRLSASGVKKFEGLAPGRYAVSLWLEPEDERGWGPGRQIDRVEVSISAGQNFATVAIPALYSFEVIYLDGKEGTTFGLSRIAGDDDDFRGGYRADLDAKGVARFVDIPAGDYTLSSWSGRRRQMEIRVPCKTIEFVPVVLNALLFELEDETGDLGRLGFRNGDLVIGIDGEEFDGEPSMSLFGPLYAAKSAKVSFLIERGGDRLEIEVTGADIGDWQSLGGRLKPTSR